MNMSNGGGESGREREEFRAKRKFGGTGFESAISKIAVAQICESLGFQGFQQSALDTLSDIAARYIHNLGKTAHSNASLAGRTESDAFDIIQGLEDLGSGLGFTGLSDLDHCLASSGAVTDVVNYIQEAENIPFAYSLPHFPVFKKRKQAPSFCQNGDNPPDEHIPRWLPAFPDLNAHVQPKEGNERESELERDTNELGGAKREEEKPLANLQHNLTGNMLAGSSKVCNSSEAVKETQAAESNPFLAAPLRFGDKEVSTIVHPAKLSVEAAKSHSDLEKYSVTNHVSVQDICASVAEPVKNWLCDSKQRPLIKFKLGFTKKSLGPNHDSASLENPGLQKTLFWFIREDDENDKKKRQTQKIVTGENRTEPCQL